MDKQEYGYAVLRNMRTCRRLEEGQWVGATWKDDDRRSNVVIAAWIAAIVMLTAFALL